MKIFRNGFIILVCLALVFSLSACKRQTAGGYYVDFDDSSNIADTDNSTGDLSSGGNASAGVTGKKNNGTKNTASSKAGGTVSGSGNKRTEAELWKIRRDIKPSAKSSKIKNLNLEGKKLRMLVWNSNWTERDEDTIAAFEKKFNCKVEVTNANYESYFNIISTQLSSGKPFDIIRLHRAHFPHAAIAKMIQPIEDYVAEEDLTTTYKKPGVDWDWTVLNSSWNNHIYYTLSARPCALPVMIYNKVLFQKFGLEDPMTLWKSGKWNLATIENYAKQVKAADKNMYFYDSTVSKALCSHATGDAGYFEITKDGTVKWLGANTALYNKTVESMRLLNLSHLEESSARLDSLTSGKCMLHSMELDQLITQTKTIEDSAAFGKDINNLGVVPIPYNDNGSYNSTGVTGYASSRGCDPTAAIALTVFYASQNEGWDTNTIPAVQQNRDILYSLYDKMTPVHNYTFRTADGKQESDILYQMNADIKAGGDIMKLLESYAPKVKTMMEYSLSKQ